jgi:hypothetical protein
MNSQRDAWVRSLDLQILRRVIWCTACTCLLLAGCTDFEESYYVGIYDPPQNPPQGSNGALIQPAFTSNPTRPLPTQFYRYDIGGYSILSTTRFEAGLYDAKAVDTLFGEVKQPAATSQPSSPGEAPSTTGAMVMADGSVGSVPVSGTSNTTTLSASNVTITPDPGAGLPNFSLKQLASLDANVSVTVTLKSANGANILNQITSISASKITSAIVSISANGQQPMQLTEATAQGQFSCGYPQSVSFAGGTTTVYSNGGQMGNGSWTGTMNAAQCGPLNDGVQLQGGQFHLYGADAVQSLGIIQLDGGIGTFVGVTSLVANAQDTRATLFAISSLKYTPPDGTTTKSTTLNLTFASDSGAGNITKSGGTTPPDDITMGAASGQALTDLINQKIAALSKADLTKPLVLDLGQVTLASQSGMQVSATDNGGALSLTVGKIESPFICFSDGTFHLMASPKGPAGIPLGGSVASSGVLTPNTDPNRHIFVHFGPEGTSTAQSDSQRMVVFMSSNPEALTSQISALINSQQTQDLLISTVQRPKMVQQQNTIQQAQSDVTMATTNAQAFLDNFKNTTGSSAKTIVNNFIGSLNNGQ